MNKSNILSSFTENVPIEETAIRTLTTYLSSDTERFIMTPNVKETSQNLLQNFADNCACHVLRNS